MFASRNSKARAGWVAGLATLGCVVLVPADSAEAGRTRVRVGQRPAQVWIPPLYETVERVITVPALFEDRTREVWRQPLIEDRRVAIEIPAEIVMRNVPRYGRYGRLVGYDVVEEVIQPTRTEWRTERVEVRAGYYETVFERVLIRSERTRVVQEQVLVREGRWTQGGSVAIRKSRPGCGATRVSRLHRPDLRGEHRRGVRVGFRLGR